ncbi:MAG: helix-turn-helix domain-containing protein [Coriobacteriaceae bacterium]|uniref:helix-turn-helix transcriptional regulator n=1 Tax=Tractidigestivibacter sp. TaxID=2847320 RepID=UPI002A910997|nr:helix-turn-helix transcriptional regulator [Tractidigestivibacter sp.]MCI6274564.1 helix-turn-helix domain-containing protein [Coriobacteriaceae bacterium]MCI6843696.1 helix-turn-helix domain-containing protein [Coriobacteriaceae bacterium]MDD7584327.1 helix-turn-helix transcriptional regulator [Coriobacteriaceae bacterium]MDY5272312.1 helix-turn-helix transcriptional regulator [Tractidigestivibacter sp.]
MDESRTSAQQIIGARIRELRKAAGISQAELARRVYVSRQTVGNWEAGRTLADAQASSFSPRSLRPRWTT